MARRRSWVLTEYTGLSVVRLRVKNCSPSGSSTNCGRITPGGRNDVKYQCWRPEQLMNAYGGDWNLNTRYGLRKLGLMDNGVPKRMMETPIAWPSYAGYPPDRDGNGKLIDYGLKQNGGILSLKPQKHPDMVRSHQNRLAAGIPPKSYTSFRHAGERHY